MKKQTFAAIAAVAALAGSAHGQTVIDITGSTAGRAAVHNQILALLSGETFGYTGNSASGHSRAIYKGTFNGKQYIVRTAWSGSALGIGNVVNAPQLNNTYLVTSTDTSAGTTSAGVLLTSPVLAPASAETVTEIGFSDVFPSSTIYTANPAEEDAKVGIIPFKFFRNEGSSAGLTNMTPGLFRTLYRALGEAPLHLFTGVAPVDPLNPPMVYATGRDSASGTRITAMAETGAGVFNDVNQWMGTVSGGVATLTFAENNGFTSGGDVATLLGGTYAGGDIVGYLGASDWNSAVNNGAVEMQFNGVTFSEERVRNGLYSFWGYLHQVRLSLDADSQEFFDDLRDALIASPGNGLILESTMRVERGADGAQITPK